MMTQNKTQKQMLEYIIDNFSSQYKKDVKDIGPYKLITAEKINDFDSNIPSETPNYSKIIIIDKHYPNFKDLLKKIGLYQIPNLTYILNKSGKDFFRFNKPELKHGKAKKGLSLKNYSSEEINKMITFSLEEKYLFQKNQSRYFPSFRNSDGFPVEQAYIQYYQDGSDRLSECLVTFLYNQVISDYTHDRELTSKYFMNGREREALKNTFIWIKRYEISGTLYPNPKLNTISGTKREDKK